MKHFLYKFTLKDKLADVSIKGTSVEIDGPYFRVKDGDEEVALFVIDEVQGYRRFAESPKSGD